MKTFEKTLSDDELKNSIKENVCNRNRDLVSLINLLNHLPDDNIIVALDGGWGSGKTCLIRELEMIWQDETMQISGDLITDDALKKYRTNYIPFYYNAWENDYANDPAQSLLVALAEHLEENQNIIAKSGRKLLARVDISACIKAKTNGLINLEGIDTNPKISKYTPEVNRDIKLRKVISELIKEDLKMDENCRFLFIIDDLDRCKPTYAIKLIEAIKNIFNSNKIVFLIATNFAELGNIVRGYYGGYIDGHQYLDRVFDYKIRLNDIDTDSYITYKMPEFDTWAIKNVASNLKMNMRELNRYLGIIRLCKSYLIDEYIWRDKIFHIVCRRIFLPIFIGYKIKNFEIYNKLMSGNGCEIILSYMEKSSEMKNYAEGILQSELNEENDLYGRLEANYNKLFSDDRIDKIGMDDNFWGVLNLTGSRLDLD